MDKALILEKTRDFVKDKMYKEGSGHDWFHVERVCNMAKYLAQKESADMFVVNRDSTDGKSIIAGYPFFGDWGRDTIQQSQKNFLNL